MTRPSPAENVASRWMIGDVNLTILEEFGMYQRAAGFSDVTVQSRGFVLQRLARRTDLLKATLTDLLMFVGDPHLTASSKRTYRNIVRSFYRWAASSGHMEADPSERMPRVRVPRATPRPFTPSQIEAMLASGCYRRTRAMILLGYYAGLRVSQIAAVRGVDFADGSLSTVGKGGVVNIIPVHPMLTALCTSMPSGWWFPARGGREGHISGHAVSDLMHDAIHRAGIADPRLTAHSLRHSYASHMVAAGVDIRTISELMGHASVATTQIYTKVPDSMRRAGVERLTVLQVPAHTPRNRAA